MDGVSLQTRINKGYTKAALHVGLPFDIYRPTGPNNPMAVANKIGTTPAAFASHKAAEFSFGKPSDYKGALFHALLDGTQVAVGDYLKGQNGEVYFINSKSALVPMLAVGTNRVVTIWRPGGAALKPVGVSGYGGTVASTVMQNETAIMTGWPAGVLDAGMGTKGGDLPADTGQAVWRVYMPAWAGVFIDEGFILTDDTGRRMVVRLAELTHLGWNMQAMEALV